MGFFSGKYNCAFCLQIDRESYEWGISANFALNYDVCENLYFKRTRIVSYKSNAQRTRSENRFVCADFCSYIKSLRSFLGAAYDKKIGPCALTSVR